MVKHIVILIRRLCVIFLCIFGVLGHQILEETKWGYGVGDFYGPEEWKDLFSSCGGIRQSPIDISTDGAIYNYHLKPVTVFGRREDKEAELEAHATSLYLKFNNQWTISFGGQGRFKPMYIHWHWGLENDRGSEHTINGHQYVMEGHMVTYDANMYPNASVATNSPNGLYVFGILYEIGPMNDAVSKFERYMNLVIQRGKANVPEISPRELLPKDLSRYYQYRGSLTNPPCTENVMWTVFDEVQTISERQMNIFRKLKFGFPNVGPIGDNFRQTFSSTERGVSVSFRD